MVEREGSSRERGRQERESQTEDNKTGKCRKKEKAGKKPNDKIIQKKQEPKKAV